MSDDPVRAVVLGDVLMDVVAHASAPLAHASDTAASISFSGGGSAANTAAWLAGGVRTVLAGRIGDDLPGQQQVAALQRAGVEVRVAVDADHPTGTCIVVVEPGGQRTMLPDRGANLALDVADIPELPFGGHLHVSGYTLFDDGPRTVALAALQRAREAGCTTSLDPSSAAPLAALGAGEFLAMTRGVDLLLPNAEEAEVLTGSADPALAARELAQLSGAEVVVTTPTHAVHSDGSSTTTVAAGVFDALDTTGAGDAFTAGFLRARFAQLDVHDCLSAGHALAEVACSHPGARPPLADLPLLHVTSPAAWAAAQASGLYEIPEGAPFIHLCHAFQLDGVLERFYRDAGDLVVLALDGVLAEVRHETAPGGEGDFPHLYRPFSVDEARLLATLTR